MLAPARGVCERTSSFVPATSRGIASASSPESSRRFCASARVSLVTSGTTTEACGFGPLETLSWTADPALSFVPAGRACATTRPCGSVDGTYLTSTFSPSSPNRRAASASSLPTTSGTVPFTTGGGGGGGAVVVVVVVVVAPGVVVVAFFA